MRYPAAKLESLARDFLEATGSSEEEARVVAEHMIGANLRGHDSHGVGMIAMYAQYLNEGKLIPNAPLSVIKDTGPVLQFDGCRGYGQRIGREATDMAIERARKHGICMYTIGRSCHLGRIGTYGEQAAAAGMVSIHFVNVNHFFPLVAPFNGSKARFGTNPMCVAMPGTDAHGPFILDFATSIVAMGKTRVAYLAGKKFDEPVVLDVDGHPTNDPTPMWQDGEKGALMACGTRDLRRLQQTGT